MNTNLLTAIFIWGVGILMALFGISEQKRQWGYPPLGKFFFFFGVGFTLCGTLLILFIFFVGIDYGS